MKEANERVPVLCPSGRKNVWVHLHEYGEFNLCAECRRMHEHMKTNHCRLGPDWDTVHAPCCMEGYPCTCYCDGCKIARKRGEI